MQTRGVFGSILLCCLAAAAAGCHVQVDKGQNGEDKNVKIETPLGGLHVRSDQTAATDLGLPAYPGSQVAPDRDGDKSADVHLGFGQWQLRVRVVSYQTPDPRDKVLAYYRNALARFGQVIECQGNEPVGSPTVTSEGLTCSEEHNRNVHISGMSDDNGLTLRAGSRRHQHIFALKQSDAGTRFSLIELQLPASAEDRALGKSD